MRIGVLTGGGDCPGLNAAIRSVTLEGLARGWDVWGIEEGWRGLVHGQARRLERSSVAGILARGGTMLGSSRTNPYQDPHDHTRVVAHFKRMELSALVAIGGEDTLGVASRLSQEGLPVVGVPKTMDNDLSGTDYTFGFDTAVQLAADAALRLRDTAESHRRIIVLEVMGRHAGWVALYTAIACGADWCLIPEVVPDLAACAEHLMRVRQGGKKYALVVASEGIDLSQLDPALDEEDEPVDAFGHALLGRRNVAETVANYLEVATGIESRTAVIGHMQRGGPPTAFDRILATRLGAFAVDLVEQGRWGDMAALKGTEMVGVPLKEAVGQLKTVPPSLWEMARRLFR